MPAIQQRRGTAADLALANETPLAGQIYFETDTNKVKIGDGSRTYNALPYLSDSTSIADLDGLQASLDANAAAAAAAQATADSKATVASVTAVDTHVNSLDAAFAQHKNRHSISGADPLSPADIGAAPDTVVSRVTTNENDILFAKLDITNLISITSSHATDISTLQSDVAGITPASIGAQPAGTYATLVGGTVPSSQLPSYVDDVIEAAAVASFPATGDTGKIYVDTGTNKTYRWSGSTYIEIASSPGSTDAVPEGSVNLYFTDARAQNALALALAAKADTAGDSFTGTVTFPAQIITAAGVYINQFGVGIGASPSAGGPLTVRGNIDNYASGGIGGRITTGEVRITGPDRSIYATAQGMRFNAGDFYFYEYATNTELARIDESGITLPNNYTTQTGSVYGFYSQINKSFSNAATFAFFAGGDAPSQFNGPVYVSAGTLSAPSIANLSTTNTGLNVQGSAIAAIVTGTEMFRADSNGCTLGGTVNVSNGLDVAELAQSGANTNDVLTWNGTRWLPKASAGGGSTTLAGLTDVTVTSAANADVLQYDSVAGEWVNVTPVTLLGGLDTGDLSEGTNLYHTTARAEAAARGIVGTTVNTLCAGDDARLSDARTPLAHTHPQSDITNLTTDLANKVDTNDARLSDARTPLAHTHAQSEITNLVTDLSNKVDTTDARLSDARTPTAHTHPQSDITNLTTDLANKVDTTDARLSDARTPLAHTHAQSDITNLVTDLAGKAAASHTHYLADLSNFTEVGNLGPVIRTGSGQGPFYTDVSYATFASNIPIQDLSNVSVSGAATGDVLRFNGSNWASSPGVASDTTQAGGGTAVNNIVVISQGAYTALGTKDPNTIYFIT